MLKLAMEENDYLTKFWRTIKTEERKIQVRKFIRFANVMFDVNLKAKNNNPGVFLKVEN
ncbi:hypothetical protein RhiirC2_731500 [Rhizophagus irregularis]|uniref:Uncharacterized protein n=1 Tax=Rhizophagus irregularis TaxID=588596 RepID=A0A2N1NUW3_9GLOM|nr:hypothetical protein RhiirC2_731500 [Rhizophagus irregularis]